VISRYLISHSGVRADHRAGPLAATQPSIPIVDSTGFQWGDAGIGAGTAVGLMLLALGATTLARNGRVRSA